MMYITCDVISTQLTVQCHEEKTAPCELWRGSATTDDQFAYFTPRGSNTVYRYSWSTEKWDELPPSPYRNSGLVIINGELTAVRGGDVHHTNKLCTVQKARWVECYPPMNTECSSPAIVSMPDGNILVIGGCIGVGWTATVELFYVRRRTWYELNNLPQVLTQPSATVCGNELYVVGDSPLNGDGYSCSLQALRSNYQPIDSPLTWDILTWTLLPQKPVGRSTAATLSGQLVIVGGHRGKSYVNSIHQLIGGQWVEIGSMSSSRSECLVVCPLPVKMMIVGGWDEDSVEECVVVT